MIRVALHMNLGKSQKLKYKNSRFFSAILLAKAFDIDLCVFGSKSVNLKNKTIDGVFMENGCQYIETVEMPPLIDNSQSGYIRLFRDFKNSILVQQFLKPGKLRTYNLLMRDGTYKDWLIPTSNLESVEDINSYLKLYDNKIILKSINGSGGKSVYCITKEGETYIVIKGNSQQVLSEYEVKNYLKALLEKRTYVIQPFIHSITTFGEPCDIRVHCRRGREGEIFVDLLPRIGSKKGIVSNYTSGGYMMPTTNFFNREFATESEQFQVSLRKFGKEFMENYAKIFPKSRISCLGIDIGFQVENNKFKFYIFEVNAYLGGSSAFTRTSDIINQFDYYKYLYDKYNLYET